jgi:hypothetical protein
MRSPSPIHSSPCLSLPRCSGANKIAGGAPPETSVPITAATLDRVRRLLLSVALAPLILLVSACGSGSSMAATKTVERPLPAGRLPSQIARMVCQAKAQDEINGVLGVTATVNDRTWVEHKYSCRYGYPNGSFELSVKELSSWSQTLAYFHGLGVQLGDPKTLGNLGQGAFRTSGGDVVVRKDWKVLLVDVSGLPPQFGVPPTSATDVAFTVADIILGCWDGD